MFLSGKIFALLLTAFCILNPRVGAECHHTSLALESEGAHLSVSGAHSVQASCIPLQLLNRKGVLTEIPYFQCLFFLNSSFASEENGKQWFLSSKVALETDSH